MAKFSTLVPGAEINEPAGDFRGAIKVEKYRIGKEAVYVPAGFSWNYIPGFAIKSADSSHRSVTGGHCVTVTEIKPAVDLMTDAGAFTLELDRKDSMQKVLNALGR